MIAMLLISVAAVAAFGELIGYGDTSGSASASASHGDEYDEDGDSGDNGYYTTEYGWFRYHLKADASAEVDVEIDDGWARRSDVLQRAASSYHRL